MSGNDAKDKTVKLVGAVTQAFRIMRVLADSIKPQGVSAIARAAQVNPSTAFNILRTLVVEEIAEFDEPSKTYVLGRGLLKMSRRLLDQDRVEDIMVELNQLATDTGCLVGLWQQRGDRMILLERAVADRPMRLDMQVKQRMPLMLGALGRALAASRKLSDTELKDYFQHARWEGRITAKQYIGEVREAERTGFGVDREALYPGVVSVAALIGDRDGTTIFGLTASGFTSTMDEALTRHTGERLAAIARTHSRSQG